MDRTRGSSGILGILLVAHRSHIETSKQKLDLLPSDDLINTLKTCVVGAVCIASSAGMQSKTWARTWGKD